MTVHVEVTSDLPSTIPVVGHLMSVGLEPLTAGARATGAEELRGFAGKVGDALVRPGEGSVEILVGIGEAESAGAREMRRAAATFARSLSKATSAALDLRGVHLNGLSTERLVQVAVEGVVLALYRFDGYRSTDPDAQLESFTLVVDAEDLEAAARGVVRGRAIAEAVSLTRDLVNRPPGNLTPTMLAGIASEVAERGGVAIEVLAEEDAAAERLGGLLGVARGSDEPARLVRMTYEPEPSVARTGPDGKIPTVALVGKGITFDSGGLSIKTVEGMMSMKMDMSGAAAVIAVAGACRALGVGVRVIAIAPVTENMPGGRATRPGDVLTIRNNKTIEVLNTDAEGRLVLADGLSLAAEAEPDAIVDIATLTGACVVALGTKIAGLMGNDSAVLTALEEASERSGEPLWRLPLPRDYRKDIDSSVADMKNMGKPRQAGALVAGLLLEEFVAERPWAHIDMAGPMESDEERFEIRRGATGFGVRTLIEFIEAFEPSGHSVADRVGMGS